MPRSPGKPCPTPGCPGLVRKGACSTCSRQAEQRRGSAAARGYTGQHVDRFRAQVLRAQPWCVLCLPARREPSTVADHWPRSRRQLVAEGLDPNDPQYGRGICHVHHSRETARHQPGGFAAR